MNPNTYLIPLLGLYTVIINKNGIAMPIYFEMKRSVRDFDRECLEEDDMVYCFDIKGQI